MNVVGPRDVSIVIFMRPAQGWSVVLVTPNSILAENSHLNSRSLLTCLVPTQPMNAVEIEHRGGLCP